MVKDIFPGPGNSSPFELTNVNGTLFFQANGGWAPSGSPTAGLWKSDGTANGTVLVKDIRPGGASSPRELTVLNGTVFFTADDGVHGLELWKSDGSEAGTVLVKDIMLGGETSNARSLTNVNGTLLFAADDGTPGGRKLWKSDGTEEGIY